MKLHKADNPMSPIISQCPTPTYNIAKQLNAILTPYIPNKYCVKSSTEVIKLLKSTRETCTMASYDVESLLTNVPVDTTIQHILDKVHQNDTTPHLNLKKKNVKRFSEICTKQSPFVCPDGRMYEQIDGVAKESPIGI